MHDFSHGILFFAAFYAVYALGSTPLRRHDVAQQLERIPKVWPLAPVRLLAWLIFLPFASLFEALLLAFVAFSIGALMIALR